MAKYFNFNLIKNRYKTVILIVCFVVALVLFITSLLPFEYESSAQLLIIQEDADGDLYKASKAAERLGTSLSKVIYTTSFYNRVLASNVIDESYFSSDEAERRQEWNKAVKAEVVPQTSILKIYAYSTDKQRAENIASGVAYVLSTSGSEYYGENNQVSIKTVNPPLTSDRPVKPNIVLNLLVGLVVGLLISIVYLMFAQQVKKNSPKPTKKNIVKKAQEEIKEKRTEEKEDIFQEMREAEEEKIDYRVLDMNNYRHPIGIELEPLQMKSAFSMYDHLNGNIIS